MGKKDRERSRSRDKKKDKRRSYDRYEKGER